VEALVPFKLMRGFGAIFGSQWDHVEKSQTDALAQDRAIILVWKSNKAIHTVNNSLAENPLRSLSSRIISIVYP